MTEQRKRRPAAPAVGRQIKELEERLAHLEAMLDEVRSQAGRASGPARARLERVAEAVTERAAQARETLGVSLDRLSRAVLDSRARIEREVSLLTRGLRAGVRAGRAAYRAKPRK